MLDLIDGYVEKLNAELNRWETIKKWTQLDHDLSVERGELTPSLKVKRSVVAERNKAIIDAFSTDDVVLGRHGGAPEPPALQPILSMVLASWGCLAVNR